MSSKLSRRGLFGLIPAPFAGAFGLLTTKPAPSTTPDSDPVAVEALVVRDTLLDYANIPVWIDKVRRFGAENHPTSALSAAEINKMEADQRVYQQGRINSAETQLKAILSQHPGLTIAIEGRVYSAGRPSRSGVIVAPVWVAMLTPKA